MRDTTSQREEKAVDIAASTIGLLALGPMADMRLSSTSFPRSVTAEDPTVRLKAIQPVFGSATTWYLVPFTSKKRSCREKSKATASSVSGLQLIVTAATPLQT